VADATLIGRPERPAPLVAELVLEVSGPGAHRFTLARAVDFAWTDPVAGERRRPLEILPPVTLDPSVPLLGFPDAHGKELRVQVSATAGPAAGEVRPVVTPADAFTVEPTAQKFKLARQGDTGSLTFTIKPPAAAADRTATLALAASVGAATVTTGVRRIEHPHIPIQTVLPPAQVKLVRLAMKRGGARIGYIPGAGDEVPAALRQAGYDVTVLGEEALAAQPLGRFDALVTGVRAFNVNPHLFQLHEKLMNYVSAGGTLLVQYNTQNRMTRIAGEIGPYPFNISQERVTDEEAAVRLADHSRLKTPHSIGAADFAGWVQERGLYFADKWDDHYQAPLTMNDPGEPPRKGGLLIAPFGKGTFVYTGIAFFRQLPAGVPGAFRLFANLLAHGH
jgi:hypothetical protein